MRQLKRSKMNLSDDCISLIISFTTPRDACRFSAVSRCFKRCAAADVVWKRFLPADYREIISRSASPELLSPELFSRDLFFSLSRNPIIINDGTMSFALDRESGKKCYMLGARRLTVIWGNTPAYWTWPRLPESRFVEVAHLNMVWWLEVKGNIETNILSPNTTYIAYLVFKFARGRRGFEGRPVQFGVYFEGRDDGQRRNVLLDPPENMPQLAQDRGGGWMEVAMGEFFNENGDDGNLMCTLFDFDGSSPKIGLIIEGIELRPMNGR